MNHVAARPSAVHDPSLQVVLCQVLTAEPPAPSSLRPEIPRELEAICLRCLAKDPAKRYSTAAALVDDLQQWLDPQLSRPCWEAALDWRAHQMMDRHGITSTGR